MKSTIDAYFSGNEVGSLLSTQMAKFVVDVKNSPEFHLVKKIVESNVKNLLLRTEDCNLSPDRSQAILHKISGLNTIEGSLNEIIKYDLNLIKEEAEKAREKEEEDKQNEYFKGTNENTLI